MFVAIGYANLNKARAKVYKQSKEMGYTLVSYVSSKAMHWGEYQIGDNCFIYEGTVLQPFVTIGKDVIIGSGNQIGHDSIIGDHCFIAGHALIPGYVNIGSYTFIGSNATLREGINVAPETIIGAGAVVLRDTKQGEVYAAERTKPSHINSSTLEKTMLSPYFQQMRSSKKK